MIGREEYTVEEAYRGIHNKRQWLTSNSAATTASGTAVAVVSRRRCRLPAVTDIRRAAKVLSLSLSLSSSFFLSFFHALSRFHSYFHSPYTHSPQNRYKQTRLLWLHHAVLSPLPPLRLFLKYHKYILCSSLRLLACRYGSLLVSCHARAVFLFSLSLSLSCRDC